MAKLLKHLGLGGGGNKKSSTTSSNSPQCDRVRQLFPEPGSPLSGHGSPLATSGQHALTDAETDSSAASTVSSANRSTIGSEDLPNPPLSWLNSSNSSVLVSSNSSSTEVGDQNGARPKEQQAGSKTGNIYENQEMFARPEKSKLFNEDCWNEVKKWLQEMSNPASLSSTHQPTQSDMDNARFLAEILSALQKARSEVFPNESDGQLMSSSNPFEGNSGKNGELERSGVRVGNMLSEVVLKLESEYERARKSLTSKDYERYTRLKELLRYEIQEPIYGLQNITTAGETSPHNQNPPMSESCFYDEPWNSDEIHVELEDQFQVSRSLADSCSGNNAGEVFVSNGSAADFQHHLPQSSSPHEVDARTRTGYEPPWDWKPHQKDGRKEEGYDKPWDLKPHHKDSRPSKEYEEPWDHKGPKVESDLMAAKMAKEAKASGLADGEDSKQLQKKYKDMKQPSSAKAKDYEDPWDQKTKEIECDLIAAKIAKVTARIGLPTVLNTRNSVLENTSSEGSPKITSGKTEPALCLDNQAVKKKVSTAPVSPSIQQQQHSQQPQQFHQPQQLQPQQHHPQTPQFFSPFKKPLPPIPPPSSQSPLLPQVDSPRLRWSDASRSPQGSCSHPQASLNEQMWYHGALGRSEAENLLQKQKEASFLIRKSENHPNDHSLSVRSNKGFMHLKIVNDLGGRFILGQFSQPFISIPQMVQYYTSSKLPIKGAEHISLLHPVPRNLP